MLSIYCFKSCIWYIWYIFIFIFLFHFILLSPYLDICLSIKILKLLGRIMNFLKVYKVLSRLWFFQWPCMDVRVRLWRKLMAEKLMILNCRIGEDSWGPLDCKKIQPVHPEGDKSWVFIGRTDAEAETPVLWSPHVKSWLIEKGPEAGRDWGQEKKGTTEDEMAGWHHWLEAMSLMAGSL